MAGKRNDDAEDPFAALRAIRDSLPSSRKPTDPPAPREEPPPPAGPARAVVRIERKGRGGKEATIVEKLELKEKVFEAWLDEMKRSLGCGGRIEGDAIVLQGDQRERVAAFLEKKGVRKVIRG